MAGTLLGYNIFRNGTQINEELVLEKKYIDENLEAGTYNYQVGAMYEHCESELTEVITITILLCEMPTNLAGIDDKDTAIITWNEPENVEGELLGYNIYRNENLLNSTPFSELEYRDEDLPNGEYLYQVSAVYDHCESKWIEGVTVVIDYVGINDVQTSSYQIFPNPTKNEFRVLSSKFNIQSIEIFDVMGRKVQSFEFNVQSSETRNFKPETLNISYMPSGVYFLRIQTENGVVMRKVVKQ
jgi:hypothetical protein